MILSLEQFFFSHHQDYYILWQELWHDIDMILTAVYNCHWHSKWQKCTFHCIASSESKLVKSLLYSAPHNCAAAELTSGWRRQRYEPPSNLTSWNCFCDSTLFGEIKEYEAWMTLKPWQMSLDAKSAKLKLPRSTKTKTNYFESK